MRSGQFIQWQDLFTIIDDGAIPLARYDPIESAMRDQARQFPDGIACLVILPPGAKPPPDDVKKGVKGLLTRLGPSLACLAYLVEGTGFKGVAARAALVGMKIFASRTYPIYVETSMPEVLGRVLPHLAKGKTVTSDVNVIMKVIAEARTQRAASSPAAAEVDAAPK